MEPSFTAQPRKSMGPRLRFFKPFIRTSLLCLQLSALFCVSVSLLCFLSLTIENNRVVVDKRHCYEPPSCAVCTWAIIDVLTKLLTYILFSSFSISLFLLFFPPPLSLSLMVYFHFHSYACSITSSFSLLLILSHPNFLSLVLSLSLSLA